MRSNEPTDWSAVLAQTVRRQRRALGMTQQELARLAGCGVAFLYQLEAGKRTLRLDKVVPVLRTLGLQLVLTTGGGGIVADEPLA